MPLTKEQADIITATVPVLEQHGNTITKVFYGNMLREVPALNNIFNTSNQRNGHQPQALAATLYAYAANINNLEVLGPAVERICQKHASLYITAEQYDIVGKYLLAAMGEVLGDALTPDIAEAWGAAYWQIANLMIAREKELLKQTEGWNNWRDFKIDRKERESDEVTSFYLKPVDGKALPLFLPGQYISIMLDVPDLKYKQARQYSLSDKPSSEYYRISVKREKGLDMNDPESVAHPGYISNTLHDHREVGDVVQLSHPAGDFFLDVRKQSEDNPVVLISAGVGLTPLLSMLNTLVEEDGHRNISWIHASRNSKVQPFTGHIADLVKSHPNITEELYHSNPSSNERQGVDYDIKGRMDLSKLESEEQDLKLGHKDAQYYICGPEKFMTDVELALRDRGVASERINMEVFGTGGIPRS